MPKFKIFVTREITESAFVTVEADSQEEAEDRAIENHNSHNYETDDYVGDVYVTHCEELK